MMIFKRLYARLWATHVGTDMFGNAYYKRVTRRGEKRWVLYHGLQEASKVPAEWHGWLHHTCAEPLTDKAPYSWQKRHHPNLTGTGLHPPYKRSKIAHRPAYQAWAPSSRSS